MFYVLCSRVWCGILAADYAATIIDIWHTGGSGPPSPAEMGSCEGVGTVHGLRAPMPVLDTPIPDSPARSSSEPRINPTTTGPVGEVIFNTPTETTGSV